VHVEDLVNSLAPDAFQQAFRIQNELLQVMLRGGGFAALVDRGTLRVGDPIVAGGYQLLPRTMEDSVTALRSSSIVSLPATRARTTARFASAKVSAEVTLRLGPRRARMTVLSCSSRAASSALDSI